MLRDRGRRASSRSRQQPDGAAAGRHMHRRRRPGHPRRAGRRVRRDLLQQHRLPQVEQVAPWVRAGDVRDARRPRRRGSRAPAEPAECIFGG